MRQIATLRIRGPFRRYEIKGYRYVQKIIIVSAMDYTLLPHGGWDLDSAKDAALYRLTVSANFPEQAPAGNRFPPTCGPVDLVHPAGVLYFNLP